MRLRLLTPITCVCLWLSALGSMLAQSGNPCPRYVAGSTIVEPEDLFSVNGGLALNLTYRTRVDSSGNTLFCFMNSDGAQSLPFTSFQVTGSLSISRV